MQREADRRVDGACERHARGREVLGNQLAGLREKQRTLSGAVRVVKGGSPSMNKGGKKAALTTASHELEQVEAAIRAKTAELEAMPVSLSKQERQRVRAAFLASVEAAAALAADVASVEIRLNNLVFHKA